MPKPWIVPTRLRDLTNSHFKTSEPLIVSQIPDVNNEPESNAIDQQITSRKNDLIRMSRLLIGDFRTKLDISISDLPDTTDPEYFVREEGRLDNPRRAAGNKFLANLALINQQSTLDKIAKRDSTNLSTTAFDGAKDTAKIIASTLAQIPVAGTGTHFVNGGKVGKEYLKGSGGGVGTFLRNLTGTGGGLQGHERILSGRPIIINKQQVDENENGSLLQRYNNKIENEDQRSKPELTKAGDSNLRQPYKNRNNPDTAFFTRLRKQQRTGDDGRYTVDLINVSSIMDESADDFQDLRNADTIPFEFQIFDPEAGGTPEYIYFRAYLNKLDDIYTGEWNSTKYIGRAENLYNYTGFNRGFSFDFNLAAHTREELKPLYKKLNRLVSTTAPSYSTSFMRGVFTKLTIGDYLSAVPGFFTNISVTWNTNYPWEIGLGENYEAVNTLIVPHLLDVSLQFQPVHDFNPAFKEPFIGSRRQTSRLDSREGVGLGTFGGSQTEDKKETQKALKERNTKFGKFLQSKTLKATEEGIPEVVKTINIDSSDTNPGLNYIDYDGFDLARKDPTSLSPPPPPRETNTLIPFKTPLESNPFGG